MRGQSPGVFFAVFVVLRAGFRKHGTSAYRPGSETNSKSEEKAMGGGLRPRVGISVYTDLDNGIRCIESCCRDLNCQSSSRTLGKEAIPLMHLL